MNRKLGGFNDAGSSSDSFIDRLKDRDELAWSRFVATYGALVELRYIDAGVEEEQADELKGEVIAAALKGIDDFKPGKFRGWLWRIAMNKLMDHYRQYARPDRAVGGSDVVQRMQQIAQQEDRRRDEDVELARAAFRFLCDENKLTSAQREVLLAAMCRDISYKEAADQLGTTVGALYKRISRLRQDIRNICDDDDADEDDLTGKP